MQLTIQLTSGRECPFTLTDGESSKEFLKTVKYWEVFDRPILRIHDRKDTWTFNPTSIETIRFKTADDPKWAPPDNIIFSKCISLESYRRKFEAASQGNKISDRPEGKFFEVILEVTMTSGNILYFESFVLLSDRRQQMINLNRLFHRLGHAIKCETDEIILLNPNHIGCVRMHPGISEDKDSAWLVDGFAGSE